ncbi:phage portal protein [Amedibacillus sp. YH-ame6]
MEEKISKSVDNSVYDRVDTGNPDPSRCYGETIYPKKVMKGRIPLEIPVSKENVNEDIIKKYLPKIFRILSTNVGDYEHLYNVYKGYSNIQRKVRKQNPDKENNIVDERHPYYMVEFKKGYMYGNDTKYSCSDSDDCTDELTVFSLYMKEQEKAMKNVEIAQDVYICGVGNRFILPKPSYSTLDVSKKAPFEIFNLDYRRSFIVYSSNYTHEMLFGGIITTIDGDNPDIEEHEIMIYDSLYSYKLKAFGTFPNVASFDYVGKNRHYMGIVPFNEWKINKARIGIVEVVEPILDSTNAITSNSIDNIIDYVNSILLVYNQSITKQVMEEVYKNMAMELKSVDPSRPADAKYLVNALNHADVNTKYETMVKVAYNVVGVPQATTQSTSGGDTGEARSLGGGWASADIVASQDEICLKESERDMARKCLAICKKHPFCPIKNIEISDIEINFNRNRNDNLLVKTQSLQNLYTMNVPKEIALNYVGISPNSHEDAKAWEDADKKAKENSLKEAAAISKTNDDTEIDNGSGIENEKESNKNPK